MATRLYLHVDSSTEAGTLPTTEQSSRTAVFNFDAQTVNRLMDTNIGTAQTSVTHQVTTNYGINTLGYVTKFISPELNQTSIAANTWRYNFACKHSSLSVVDDYPITDDSASPSNNLPITVYVWRPGTGVKIGNIFDSTVAGYVDTGNYTGHPTQQTTNEISEDGTFTGSSVAGVQTGDVIILEAWISVWTRSTTAVTLSYFFDGITETLTDGTVVSNHASFLETPEALVFAGAATNTFRQYNSYSNTGFMPSQASVIF
jgi:hypothetical protein